MIGNQFLEVPLINIKINKQNIQITATVIFKLLIM